MSEEVGNQPKQTNEAIRMGFRKRSRMQNVKGERWYTRGTTVPSQATVTNLEYATAMGQDFVPCFT